MGSLTRGAYPPHRKPIRPPAKNDGSALTRSDDNETRFITLDKLSVSKTNMRYGKKAPDVSDILPTVRKRGILQPLVVRTNCSPGAYEILAGTCRLTAAQIVRAERLAAGEPTGDAIPCAIIEEGDDADAIEASMIENMARLDADEVTQWESFTRRSGCISGSTWRATGLPTRRSSSCSATRRC